jgi:hypothetical protein
MIPFIVKFAAIVRRTTIDVLPWIEYDPESELTIHREARAKKLAIDEERVSFATGSLITETSSDTTRDEPTDR